MVISVILILLYFVFMKFYVKIYISGDLRIVMFCFKNKALAIAKLQLLFYWPTQKSSLEKRIAKILNNDIHLKHIRKRVELTIKVRNRKQLIKTQLRKCDCCHMRGSLIKTDVLSEFFAIYSRRKTRMLADFHSECFCWLPTSFIIFYGVLLC